MGKFLIYGAGRTGLKVLKTIEKNGGKVIGFIDAYTNLKDIKSIPIYKLKEIKQDSYLLNIPVIISVFNPKVNIKELVNILSQHGFIKIIDFLTYYKENSAFIGDIYWLSTSNKMLNTEKLNSAFSLLSDEKSKRLFSNIIKVRKELKLKDLPELELDKQYCPKDIDFKYKQLKFADCGAFIGDSLYNIIDSYSVDSIFCFEPDENNYKKLKDEAFKLTINNEINTYLWPCGVWSKNEILKFTNDSAAGTISNEGSTSIQCVSLDDIFIKNKPNYIKMDIEGAELFALHGAKNIIKTEKPVLAVCIYHKPEDLWEIPLYIHELNPDYKLYIRQYEHNLFDTVLYAI